MVTVKSLTKDIEEYLEACQVLIDANFKNNVTPAQIKRAERAADKLTQTIKQVKAEKRAT